MDLQLLFQELENNNPSKLPKVIDTINQFLNSSNSQLSRPLFQTIPRLCAYFFGTTLKRGYFHNPLKEKIMLDFLNPKSPFVLALLALEHDSTTLYSISADYLPAPSKRIFLSPDWSNLAMIYKKSITTTQNDQKTQIHSIMFNMFQYYIYCFSLCPTLTHDKLDKRTVPYIDNQYFELLELYLAFFLPSVPVGTEIPKTPGPGYVANPGTLPIMDNSSVFSCKSIENLNYALNTAQFVVESFLEMWACQNDYELLESPGLKIPVYVKPSSFQMRCLSQYLNRLVGLDLSQITTEQTSRLYQDRHTQTNVVYELNKANAYKATGIKLFRFLCSALQNWPSCDSIIEVVDLWILYAFPWKKNSKKYSIEWSLFVQENFLFYTKLLQVFVNRCLSFDFYASARPMVKKSNIENTSLKYLEITEKVLDAFDDVSLLDTVRALEAALLSLKSYSATPMLASPMIGSRTTVPSYTPKTPARTLKDRGDINYRNSGPKIRLVINQFEGTYRYSPVFHSDEEDREKEKNIGVANRVVARLWDTCERLKQVKSNHLHSKKSVKENEMNFIKSTLHSIFGDNSSSSGTLVTHDQLQVLDRNCKRIVTIIDAFCVLLGLVNPSVTPQMSMRRSASDLVGTDDEGDVLEWAPGVSEPQRIKELGSTLTLRGRNQIKYGVRKSCADSVPALISARYQTMLRGNESPFLLSITQIVSAFFDEKFTQLRVSYPSLPPIQFRWFRFFACWEHLIPLVIFTAIFLKIVF